MKITSEKEKTDQPTDRLTLLQILSNGELSAREIMNAMGLSHVPSFRKTHLKPAIENGLIERTIEENPNHPAQKYRLTEKGKKKAQRQCIIKQAPFPAPVSKESELIYKHTALSARNRQRLLLFLIENLDCEIIEFLAFKPYLPASQILVGKDGDEVSLERQMLNTHGLKTRHHPVNSLSRQ